LVLAQLKNFGLRPSSA